jgi:[ribosomal protein S18]-alanine N-acetyltransferase
MNSPAVHIRPMSAADLNRVLEIAESLHHAPRWTASAYRAAMNPDNTPRRIALAASAPESHAPVGFLVASLVPPEVELETIAVAVEAQRRGIGVLLLQALIKTLKTEPVDTLTLEVRASNQTALNFYQQNGLQQIARRPRYYANPEEDAILMRLNLINDRGHP